MFFSFEDGRKKFVIFLCSPHTCRRRIKVSNFTSGWVQYRARLETGDSRSVTSTQKRWSRDLSIPRSFHSEYSIISFIFSPNTVFFLFFFFMKFEFLLVHMTHNTVLTILNTTTKNYNITTLTIITVLVLTKLFLTFFALLTMITN